MTLKQIAQHVVELGDLMQHVALCSSRGMGDVDEIHLAAFLFLPRCTQYADVVLGEHAGHRGQHAGSQPPWI